MNNNITKARYVKLCEGRSGDLLANVKTSLEELDEYRTELVSNNTLLEKNRHYLKCLEQQFDSKKYIKMYDNLLSNKKITRIVCSFQDITILTDTLYCGRNEIGKFHIILNPSNGKIIIQNKSRIIIHNSWGEMHLPQMLSGRINFGSLNEIINELLLQRDIYNLALVIIQFIESGKVGGSAKACSSVSFWPYKGESRAQYLKRIENKSWHTRTL